MRRLLDPPESQSKRLNLREKVARIEYCVTGSTFESSLVLYDATAALFGHAEARRRLKLHTPYFLRMTVENAFPRVYTTNKLSKRGLAQMYGPFPSRLAAERYCDAVLDLFKLRRCSEDLAPYPEHPGCIYGEMEKCIKPCKQACTPEQYAAETAAVKKFFDTRGESMVIAIARDR
jgi:excinuclease ABC subunit C